MKRMLSAPHTEAGANGFRDAPSLHRVRLGRELPSRNSGRIAAKLMAVARSLTEQFPVHEAGAKSLRVHRVRLLPPASRLIGARCPFGRIIALSASYWNASRAGFRFQSCGANQKAAAI